MAEDQVDRAWRGSDGTPTDPVAARVATAPPYDAVLFDRDGTLIHDVPYNGDPDRVSPVPGARDALDRLRRAGLRLGVVSNQSGLARGRFTAEELVRVNTRVEQLLGPFDTWQVCPHDEDADCTCRKPAPGLVQAAAAALGTVPRRCLVIGDIGIDMIAAGAAGATGILVPTPATRVEEIAAASSVVADLTAAVDLVLARIELLRVADRTEPTGGARRVATRTEPVGGTRAAPDGDTRQGKAGGPRRNRPRRPYRVLVARPDSAGDLLVTGPAIRAVAAGSDHVTLLCGPRGRAAAELLPGVDEIIEWPLPWIDPEPEPVDRTHVDQLLARLAAVRADEAVVFTSFHQSALPLALLLRMAGVGRVGAISDDYPGSLLDVRHRVPTGLPEPERALSLAAACGFGLPPDDEPLLRLRARTGPPPIRLDPGYLVVHPGTSVAARACPPELCARIVTALVAAGQRVVVTGGPAEAELGARVAGIGATDLTGRTTLASLAGVIAGAACLVVGNTGPAHLAAAVGTPVVSLFAPTVPYGQWGPYRVPAVRLGDATAACRQTRATRCPVPGHPCLSGIDPAEVVAAVRLLTRTPVPAVPVGSPLRLGPLPAYPPEPVVPLEPVIAGEPVIGGAAR